MSFQSFRGTGHFIFFTGNIIGNMRLWWLPLIYTLLSVASIGMFKLRYWAIRMVIVLSSLVILFCIVFLPVMINAERGIELTTTKALTIDSLSVIFIITFFTYTIYFFTRPKIKEQFKQS